MKIIKTGGKQRRSTSHAGQDVMGIHIFTGRILGMREGLKFMNNLSDTAEAIAAMNSVEPRYRQLPVPGGKPIVVQ
jgi:hypothetical protein